MRRITIAALVLMAASLLSDPPRSAAAEEGNEKLLLGFEDAEFERISQSIKFTRRDTRTKDDLPVVAWENPGGFVQLGRWVVYSDRASQGEKSLGISLVVHHDRLVYAPKQFEIPREPVFYYGLLNHSYGSANGQRFNTCGVFRRMFPMDWSGYDLLRMDAYAEDVEQTIRVIGGASRPASQGVDSSATTAEGGRAAAAGRSRPLRRFLPGSMCVALLRHGGCSRTSRRTQPRARAGNARTCRFGNPPE